MDLPRNAFKHALAAGERQIGLWCSLCSNITVELVSDSGFDWLLLDTEHSPNELPAVLSQLQAARGGTATPIVRPSSNDPVQIKRLLDIGAPGLLIPYVQSVDEARRAVEATRYAPEGIRGVTGSGRASRYGRVPGYLQKAESEISLLLQVETREAMEQLEAIASVPGVDGVFIGPADLSTSYGYHGVWSAPPMQALLKEAVDRLTALGKPAGILTANEEEARRFLDWGYRFVAVGADLGLLRAAADGLARRFKA
ncbi:MAG: HpcH/HpaI aldolase/citrate lyase family protein [Pseudomonadota bacterium]